MIGDARLYLVAPRQLRAGPLVDLLPGLIDAGVDIVQLREKEAEALDVLQAARPLLTVCRAKGVPFVINDRPDIAIALGSDGVHIGQRDLPAEVARRIVGSDRIVGCSSHSAAEIGRALSEDIDYLAVGPVFETPTKPGRPAVGLDLVAVAAQRVRIPWFAIGGVGLDTIDAVLAAGATRVVVVRAITKAADPVAAAAAIRSRLAKRSDFRS